MTTEQEAAEADKLDRLNANLAKVEGLTQRLVAAMAQKRTIDASLQRPSDELFMKAAAVYMAEMMNNPAKIIENQVSYWGKSLKHYVEAQQLLAKGKLEAPPDPTPKDRRFANPLWETHPYFNFIKQQYLFGAEAMDKAIEGLDGLDPREKKRVEYFAQQIVDLMSPTNFLATNPDALERAVQTEGQSLVQGLENLDGIAGVATATNTVITRRSFTHLPLVVQRLSHLKQISRHEFWSYFPMNEADLRNLLVPHAEVLPYLQAAIEAAEVRGVGVAVKNFPECLLGSRRAALDNSQPKLVIDPEFWPEFMRNGFHQCAFRAQCQSKQCLGLNTAYIEKFGWERHLLQPLPANPQ